MIGPPQSSWWLGGALCLWVTLLIGCAAGPADTPPPAVDDTWWQGAWTVDLIRLEVDPSLPPDARRAAEQMARAVAPALRFDLSAARVRRTVGDEVLDEPVGSTRVQATHVVLVISGGREIELRHGEDGAWLTDDAGTRPVRRIGDAARVPAPATP